MTSPDRISVAQPMLDGNELRYITECIETEWISSAGAYLEKFEAAFAEFAGTRYAVACANGTVAIHLALTALGVGPGDEVLVPTLTYIATANAVRYCGATPVLCESDARTLNIDVDDAAAKVTGKTVGIIPVHLYGHPADMDPLNAIAKKHNLWVLEDAAEAHGAQYRGRQCGSLATAGTFSFYGNKIITTGEGGMVTTDDPDLHGQLTLLRGQGMDPKRRYWFPVAGFNYRMTNMQAAVGLAQLERVQAFLEHRQRLATWYGKHLAELSGFLSLPFTETWAHHVYWMYTIILNEEFTDQRDALMSALSNDGIETRPVFFPLHIMPPYYEAESSFPVAERLAASGINLPTHGRITESDVKRVAASIKELSSTNAALKAS